tara:strand:- start:186 stop:623 length:438 start_codon:yes stop_codon:yes gene_type:complete
MNNSGTLKNQSSASRRKSRVLAFQSLYEIDRVRHNPAHVFQNRLLESSLLPAAEQFAHKLIQGVLEKQSDIDKIIATHAPAWPINQMSVVDKNILRISIFEILFNDETPLKVSINEAVELGKIFGTSNSPKFINGVLGSISKTYN